MKACVGWYCLIVCVSLMADMVVRTDLVYELTGRRITASHGCQYPRGGREIEGMTDREKALAWDLMHTLPAYVVTRVDTFDLTIRNFGHCGWDVSYETDGGPAKQAVCVNADTLEEALKAMKRALVAEFGWDGRKELAYGKLKAKESGAAAQDYGHVHSGLFLGGKVNDTQNAPLR